MLYSVVNENEHHLKLNKRESKIMNHGIMIKDLHIILFLKELTM